MPTFTSNDAEINYQTFGDSAKPALIFSNSLGTKFSMWQPQINFFKKSILLFVMTPAAMAHLQHRRGHTA